MTDTNSDIPNIDINTENENKKETKKVSFKARAFQFTLNEPEKYDTLKSIISGLKSCDYYISCLEEAPTTGHKHIHMYVHFTNMYKINQKILNLNIHIEICKGSPKQNIDYVEKHGNILDEYGTRPKQGMKTVGDLKNIKNPDELNFNEFNTWKKVHEEQNENDEFFKMLEEIENDKLRGPKIIYIYGPSGNGKTYSAYKTALKEYSKNDIGKISINNNFCKITNDTAKCFVIEEFRPSQMHASDFLQLIDKYGYNCNVKGGFKFLRPECIIICSIISPYNIYNNEINKQFIRRITTLYKMKENHEMEEIKINLNEEHEYYDEWNIRDEDVM